jgi:hypothetical protein
MTLPFGPFVCKNIDVEAAIEVSENHRPGVGPVTDRKRVEVVIAAALGEVMPAEVEHDRIWYKSGTAPSERLVGPWQPVVSDKEQQ